MIFRIDLKAIDDGDNLFRTIAGESVFLSDIPTGVDDPMFREAVRWAISALKVNIANAPRPPFTRSRSRLKSSQ
jgi:hypothetical protein